MKGYEEYRIVTVIEYENKNRSEIGKVIKKEDIDKYLNHPEETQKLASVLITGNSKIKMDNKSKTKMLSDPNITLLYVAKDYLCCDKLKL